MDAADAGGFYFPDGTTSDRMFKKGFVVMQDPVSSHSFKNIGTADCEIVIVEKKR